MGTKEHFSYVDYFCGNRNKTGIYKFFRFFSDRFNENYAVALQREMKNEKDGFDNKSQYTVIREDDKRASGPFSIEKNLRELLDIIDVKSDVADDHYRTFLVTLNGCSKNENDRFYTFPGDRMILVRKGSVTIIFRDNKVELNCGDSIFFNSAVPHRIDNVCGNTSEILITLL